MTEAQKILLLTIARIVLWMIYSPSTVAQPPNVRELEDKIWSVESES